MFKHLSSLRKKQGVIAVLALFGGYAASRVYVYWLMETYLKAVLAAGGVLAIGAVIIAVTSLLVTDMTHANE